MTALLDPFIAELTQEAAATRRLLERVPGDQLAWRPHEKSMSLGELALHVAGLPAAVSGLLSGNEFRAEDADFTPRAAESAEQILQTHDEAVAAATEWLGSLDEAAATREWRLLKGGEALWSVPRVGMIRSLMLNHWYHHRGQLTVYLRLLDVPVPATYGRSADENPLMQPPISAPCGAG